jgi:2-polyprenyl-6-methoxyphenol hydroxylase-like FAD-dependent oxidoreductase
VESQQPRILIAGAGIGGLALAIALQRNGTTAVIWERAQGLREIGAGLLLTPNAVWILKRLGVFDQTCRAGMVVSRWEILNRSGKVLQHFRQSGDSPSISLTRSAFQQLLLAELSPEAVLLDHEVRGVTCAAADGSMAVTSTHGVTATADLLVGADGGNSAVRTVVADARLPRVLGYVGWRGLVNCVPDGWESGRITESWGNGGRFGIAAVAAGRTYWYATENAAAGWTVSVEKRKAHLLNRFQNWHDPVCDLIAATNDDDILLSPISEHWPVRSWHRESATLLGDAAHLMTPNLGQGAAMALEDGWVLAECIREHGCGGTALLRYEKLRKHRTSRVVWLSRQIGRLIQFQHPALTMTRDVALRLTPDWLGAWALRPVFNFRA